MRISAVNRTNSTAPFPRFDLIDQYMEQLAFGMP